MKSCKNNNIIQLIDIKKTVNNIPFPGWDALDAEFYDKDLVTRSRIALLFAMKEEGGLPAARKVYERFRFLIPNSDELIASMIIIELCEKIIKVEASDMIATPVEMSEATDETSEAEASVSHSGGSGSA